MYDRHACTSAHMHCVGETTMKMPCPATKVSDTRSQATPSVRKTGPQYNVSPLVPCPRLRTPTPLYLFKILKVQTVWVRNFDFEVRFTIKRKYGGSTEKYGGVRNFDFEVRFTIKRKYGEVRRSTEFRF